MDDSKGVKSSLSREEQEQREREKENRSPLRELDIFLLRQEIQLPLGSEPAARWPMRTRRRHGQAAVGTHAA